MNTDPVAFIREDFVRLFNLGAAQYKERGEGGDEKAKARYEDIAAARGKVFVSFEGDGGADLWLAVENGVMAIHDAEPEGLPPRMAIAAPADAARAGLDELEAHFDDDKAARRFARAASGDIEKVLEGHSLRFHVTFTDLPADPDEVTLRIAIGATEPPAEPTFAATISWDDIEDVRAGELTPQQLFGRLKITGDATQAMALGMTLMQRRQAR
ncbi:MAG: SCP2 sterol-binding domain-containing protein [Sandaracinaceae bacterium]|nr:SCP2 sterol-binding domain-containing protein [Sandaracinaceae bacterium]